MLRILKNLFAVLPVFSGLNVLSQDSAETITFSAYTEIYYQYNFNKPVDNASPGFLYSHNRQNEFNLNLGFIKAGFTTERVRANLAIATGTYINANYAAESGVMKNIFEANAGIRLNRKKNLWLDMGILPSHIGFESAVSKDCWTLTRSILAENSPYFEAGAKLTFITNDGKWLFSGMALNGWQRIKRVDGNTQMSWGTQVQFRPVENILLNYSTFLGTDKPDSVRSFRFFHNIYGVFNLTDRWGLTAGLDAGSADNSTGADVKNYWYATVLILKCAFDNKWSMAARVEKYVDKNGVIIPTGTPNGFQTSGYSLNLDHQPVKNVQLRLETRLFNSRDRVFSRINSLSTSNCFITSSIAVSF